jgi:hypothetical protein
MKLNSIINTLCIVGIPWENQMAKKRKTKKAKIKRGGTTKKNSLGKKWSTPKVKKWPNPKVGIDIE